MSKIILLGLNDQIVGTNMFIQIKMFFLTLPNRPYPSSTQN